MNEFLYYSFRGLPANKYPRPLKNINISVFIKMNYFKFHFVKNPLIFIFILEERKGETEKNPVMPKSSSKTKVM